MAKVFLDHVTKIFGRKVVAVDDLTLEIPDGALVGLLGPSGCGKTTTLRIIAGLEKPTKGRVYFDDEDVTDKEPRERNVAMVFQFPVLYPTVTVFENIALPLRASKMPEDQVKREVKRIAELMNITDFLDMKPGKLDIGIRQKIALAKALIRDPTIFLLDEPLTVIDPKLRIELRTKLKEIQLNLKKSMIYVTHDQTEALTLAEKIAVMNEGKILQYDTPENLYHKPKNSFVGWFIGNPGMNLIECSVSQSDGGVLLYTEGGFRYELPGFPGIRLPGKVVLGIRPEYVSVYKPGRGMEAKCVHVEHAGNRLILHLDLYDRSIKVKIPLGFAVKPGDKVSVNFSKEKIRLFDASTGDLIV